MIPEDAARHDLKGQVQPDSLRWPAHGRRSPWLPWLTLAAVALGTLYLGLR